MSAMRSYSRNTLVPGCFEGDPCGADVLAIRVLGELRRLRGA
jgi:hypothetical protein